MKGFFILLTTMAVGAFIYQSLAICCVIQFKRHKAKETQPKLIPGLPISLLKPLLGAETGLEKYLTSFFTQKYQEYEILFAMRTAADPAAAVVAGLQRRYSHIPTQIIFTGEPLYANAKVFSLEKMAQHANHELLVITDSDTEVTSDYLDTVAQAFSDPQVGALTHLYRGVAHDEFWAKLEALGMSTEFMAGVIVAEKLEGMKFALGPSMAIRKQCLTDIGGFTAMRDYLADDFILGNWSDRAGWKVLLDGMIVNHAVSTTGFLPTFQHRLRWNRSTRFSRPLGYLGQGFIYALSWSLLLFGLFPANLTFALLLLTLAARVMLAILLGHGVLRDVAVVPRLWLLPLQDLLSFASWWGGWLSREVLWRGERYRLLSGGKFIPVIARRTEN
jgi:ceramide glucosyltransferase